ncbi:MAG TPA: hypothetical protein PKD75_05455 [Tepidiformaceae bacterium]|nr:hypothetical protein [Tepidiformaceae bacterium]
MTLPRGLGQGECGRCGRLRTGTTATRRLSLLHSALLAALAG